MPLKILISTNSEIPLYRQIVEQIRRAAATGVLGEGEQLPSVRAMAEELVINPNTVARAYSDLVRDGVANSQAGKGLFIAPRRELYSQSERKRRLKEALQIFLPEAYYLGFTKEQVMQLIDQEWSKFKG